MPEVEIRGFDLTIVAVLGAPGHSELYRVSGRRDGRPMHGFRGAGKAGRSGHLHKATAAENSHIHL